MVRCKVASIQLKTVQSLVLIIEHGFLSVIRCKIASVRPFNMKIKWYKSAVSLVVLLAWTALQSVDLEE